MVIRTEHYTAEQGFFHFGFICSVEEEPTISLGDNEKMHLILALRKRRQEVNELISQDLHNVFDKENK